jgi:class 3 adenylate cyclase
MRNLLWILQKNQGKARLSYRYFKQRVDYGIGINKGSIVAKPEGRNLLEFSSLGNFANITKKIALISKEEILVGESVKDKLMKDVKFEKHNKDSLNYYSISEVKDISSGRERVNEMYQRFKSKVNEPKEKEDTPKEEDFDF